MACKSCKYFDEDETWGSKGYCDYLGSYVYPDDSSCSHYEKRGGGGCYMTSACCGYYGLPDDCPELMAMRRLRDGFMRHTERGRQRIAEYYETAPAIVEKIEASPERGRLYEEIYRSIHGCMALLEGNDPAGAEEAYLDMVNRVRLAVG